MSASKGSKDYVIRVLDNPASIDAAAWNALLDLQPSATPFMRHEYLLAMHTSKSASTKAGWTPQFLIAESGGRMVGACALYLKDHSYGEYVFDWAWADAYQRHGLNYYPKLLGAVPFTPVPGPRLMAVDQNARLALLQATTQLARGAELSSVHLLFIDEADRAAAQTAGWMMRSTVQFHWTQRDNAPYVDFVDYLATLHRDKRKKIQQERRRVGEAGIVFSSLQGAQISEEDWDFFYRCYTLTYRAHHSSPYLTRAFFREMARTMPENWLLFIATRDIEGKRERIAASLIGIDTERGNAYGRYWGATEYVPNMHFEACYYQPLAWCIANRMKRFEGGAQGEHKMARGLMPVQTWSAHWLAHPQFAQAVADYLAQEGVGIAQYIDELNERAPFKADASSSDSAQG